MRPYLALEPRTPATMHGRLLASQGMPCVAVRRRAWEPSTPWRWTGTAASRREFDARVARSGSASANAVQLLSGSDLLLSDAIDPQLACSDTSNCVSEVQPAAAKSALTLATTSNPSQHAWLQPWPNRSRSIRVDGSSSRNVRAMASVSATSGALTSTSQLEDGASSVLRPLHGHLLQHLIASAATVQHIQDIVVHHREALQPAHIKALLLKLRHIVRETGAAQQQLQQSQHGAAAAGSSSGSTQLSGHVQAQAQAPDAAGAENMLPSLVKQLRQLLQASSIAAQAAEATVHMQGRLELRGPTMPIDGPVSAPPLHGLAAQVGRQLSSGQALQRPRQRQQQQTLGDEERRQLCRRAVETLYGMAQARNATDIGSVLSICKAHMSLMQPAQLSSVAWSLAKLDHPPGATWMAAFYAQTQAQAERFGPRELCTILWAAATLFPRNGATADPFLPPSPVSAAKAACAPPTSWLTVWVQRCGACMAGFSARDLSQTLWALAKLRHRPDAAWLQAALGHANAAHAPQAARGSSTYSSSSSRQLSARDLANMMWALASMQINPGPRWTSAAISTLVAQGRLDAGARSAASAHDVSQMLWALAALRHHLPPPLMHALVLCLCAQPLGSLLPQDVSTSLWALAVLEYQPTLALRKRLLDHIVAVLVKAATAPAVQPAAQSGTADMLAAAGAGSQPGGGSSATQARLQGQGSVTAGGIANTRSQQQGNALGSGTEGPGQQAHKVPQPPAGFTIAPRVNMSTALPVLMWALTRLRWAEGRMRLLALASRVAALQAPLITPQGAVMVLYGLSRAQYQPRPGTVDALIKRLRVNPDGSGGVASPLSLALLLRALGSLHYQPPRLWLRRLLARTMHLLPRARLPELCNLARGLALLRHRPDALWLSMFAGCLRKAMVQADPAQLTSGQQRWLAWALPRIRVRRQAPGTAKRMRKATRQGSDSDTKSLVPTLVGSRSAPDS